VRLGPAGNTKTPPPARNRPAKDRWDILERIADHQNRSVDDVWSEQRLTNAELAQDPLAL
jgi:hypothetical protein